MGRRGRARRGQRAGGGALGRTTRVPWSRSTFTAFLMPSRLGTWRQGQAYTCRNVSQGAPHSLQASPRPASVFCTPRRCSTGQRADTAPWEQRARHGGPCTVAASVLAAALRPARHLQLLRALDRHGESPLAMVVGLRDAVANYLRAVGQRAVPR